MLLTGAFDHDPCWSFSVDKDLAPPCSFCPKFSKVPSEFCKKKRSTWAPTSENQAPSITSLFGKCRPLLLNHTEKQPAGRVRWSRGIILPSACQGNLARRSNYHVAMLPLSGAHVLAKSMCCSLLHQCVVPWAFLSSRFNPARDPRRPGHSRHRLKI